MEQASSVVPIAQSPRENRRLERAVFHINNLWFPINVDLLGEILKGFEEGRYDFGVEFLIEDLKKDLALYVYCIRELSMLLRQEGVRVCIKEPLELLNLAGKNRIKKVLSVNPRSISQHSSNQLSELQAKQLAASITSAATAEALVQGSECPSESAYLTAVLRQLGLILICWNYPSAYQKAISRQSTEQSIDAVISELLGFTPLLLVFRLVKEWGLAPEIELALKKQSGAAEQQLFSDSEIEGDIVSYLASLCEIGEALARANQPEIYSTAAQDWEMARSAIQQTLGTDGLQVITQRAQEYCSVYRKENPELSEMLTNLNPERTIHQQVERNLLNSNPFAERCPLIPKKLFKEYYRLRSVGRDNKQSLTFLFKEVFPALGFSGGIVYTVNAETSELMVRLHLGNIISEALRKLSFKSQHDQGEAAVAALHCSTLIQGQLPLDEDCSFIAARLGQGAPVGVLYVELPTSLLHDPELDFINHFKALKLALHHAFGLPN